jgi:hypothetical protein
MAGNSTIPSPREIAGKLAEAPQPSEPALDLATLEDFHHRWVYPKSLDYWEGYVYADLCEQLGWSLVDHGDFREALSVWRECPWPSATCGEQHALAQLLQEAYDTREIVLGPPVADLLSYGRLPLGTIVATLNDSGASLRKAASGIGYVVESRIVKPDGLYFLRFEFDIDNLFYVSFLPAEVQSKVFLARSNFQMGEAEEAARWLLKAAFGAYNRGLHPEAISFLEKAQQLDCTNQAVKASLNSLVAKGVAPSLFSRVLVERSLFQPDPLMRCEIRPEVAPEPVSPWREVNWLSKLSPSQFKGEVGGKIASLGLMPTDKARDLVSWLYTWLDAWPLLLPAGWQLPRQIELEKVERGLSVVRGVGLERLGLWKSDYREVLSEMLEAWPAGARLAPSEVIEFALPEKTQVCLFSCTEPWMIPLLLELELPELGSVERLAAWLRRFLREWGARPLLFADDVIWFQVKELPEGARRELFLADLMSFSSDVSECFEPTMIRPTDPEGAYLFPVPLQLHFKVRVDGEEP